MNITISKQQIGSETINSVNARELHSFLESKQQFADWIKNRISKPRF
ncbi:antA/AntB antirepressor family protein [Allofrancisella guangzhouensis]|nr:antA/AntB antirepressor family protein [Allofrancisella guangzhouensis]MBK2044719.1 antA/AntB antirepressor family protein [Allofrancisella guangzhouensis]MBK2045939.1 antA/AntB antirepressor family protein [Allofrancisella guangzhouensis]